MGGKRDASLRHHAMSLPGGKKGPKGMGGRGWGCSQQSVACPPLTGPPCVGEMRWAEGPQGAPADLKGTRFGRSREFHGDQSGCQKKGWSVDFIPRATGRCLRGS